MNDRVLAYALIGEFVRETSCERRESNILRGDLDRRFECAARRARRLFDECSVHCVRAVIAALMSATVGW
jgi:hypothetical protein